MLGINGKEKHIKKFIRLNNLLSLIHSECSSLHSPYSLIKLNNFFYEPNNSPLASSIFPL